MSIRTTRRSSIIIVAALSMLTSSCTAWTWGGSTGSSPMAEAGEWIATTSGQAHRCRIASDQSLWCEGLNNTGQIGDGTTDDRTDPVQIGTDSWLTIDAALASTCGIRTDRTLWCWGYLATDWSPSEDPASIATTPTQIGNDVGWASVEGYGVHWCATKTDGSLWCWGNNDAGQLGDGSLISADLPIRVGTASWRSVGAATLGSCGVQTDGSLWCWGGDAGGSTGLEPTQPGDNPYLQPTQVGSDHDWTDVATGELLGCAIRTDDTLWCWGSYGWLGERLSNTPVRIGTSANWRSVRVGMMTACAIQHDNSMWCWGENRDGWVGDGTTEERWDPVQIGIGRDWVAVDLYTRSEGLALP